MLSILGLAYVIKNSERLFGIDPNVPSENASGRSYNRFLVVIALAHAVVLFTTGIQVSHLARVAREEGIEDAVLETLRRRFVGSIGPTMTEALEEFGVHPAFEPSHPKMGVLVLEAAQRV